MLLIAAELDCNSNAPFWIWFRCCLNASCSVKPVIKSAHLEQPVFATSSFTSSNIRNSSSCKPSHIQPSCNVSNLDLQCLMHLTLPTSSHLSNQSANALIFAKSNFLVVKQDWRPSFLALLLLPLPSLPLLLASSLHYWPPWGSENFFFRLGSLNFEFDNFQIGTSPNLTFSLVLLRQETLSA